MSAPSPPSTRGAGSPPLHHSSSAANIAASNGPAPSSSASTTLDNNSNLQSPNDAATKLAEAIDDFLGDLEKRFKGISDEILTKLDDMAERCDRLEQEMLLRDASGAMENVGGGSGGGGGGKAGSTAGST
ncbi:uncharacterized protein Z520_00453 [Fonsecaea multimorphosa CBS 102226]|uniref:Uncharacterized protein n=1 Tax=Fonsecaea multimorphosa CBS 102226 TaxID=1442371 RepID=A0A0D2J2U5_9EURO|nr:uncharacterized protein Z520_00453 [Fonsecaea multimorphosa CBS 102226]KIY03762.1 hypothetical protein Z520_00453 [Fonsecaea multimorphosa CBS 102226]